MAAAKRSAGLMKAAANRRLGRVQVATNRRLGRMKVAINRRLGHMKVATKIEETKHARKAASGPTVNAPTRVARQQNEGGSPPTFVC